MQSEVLKGHADLLLLAALESGPAHGYAIVEAIRSRSGGTFDLAEGTVYPALYRLERRGLLASDWVRAVGARRRRVYRLTRGGRKEAASDPESLKRIWDRAKACEGWAHVTGPESIWLWGQIGMLVKASMKAAASAGSSETSMRMVCAFCLSRR